MGGRRAFAGCNARRPLGLVAPELVNFLEELLTARSTAEVIFSRYIKFLDAPTSSRHRRWGSPIIIFDGLLDRLDRVIHCFLLLPVDNYRQILSAIIYWHNFFIIHEKMNFVKVKPKK